MSKSSADSGDPPSEHQQDGCGPPKRPPENNPNREPNGGTMSPNRENRDDDHWRELFQQTESGLRKFLAGKLPQAADVEDCLQTVMVAMLKNQSKIPLAARRAWLFRVAANQAALWWRTKSTTDRVLEKHASSTYAIDTDCATQLETQEALQRVEMALSQLPPDSRQIVCLRLHDGYTFQAIADQMQLPLGTVLTRMRRAMQQLRSELDDDSDSDDNERNSRS
ncbi:RNA polymerase sigma factor [Stieleria sp. TO1_6]|uniref:RNA polymerase sigma factor n=1 Tax=Stieleria tagensis TaxID=2956795 RepID=UPI00209AEE59|nr:RNA polymerase sigma factor [Stieleria tagensis]MCO8124238.1 RNA polymerase sigma factor [Stieleria tagensis]